MNVHNKKDTFIILTTGRTGSTYLVLWLNSLKNIRCHGEVFGKNNNKDGFLYFSNKNVLFKVLRKISGDASSYFRQNILSQLIINSYFKSLIYNTKHNGPWQEVGKWDDFILQNEKDINAQTVGFKLIFDQYVFYKNSIHKWAEKNNPKIIHLYRENLLDVFLSFKEVEARGIYHASSKYEIKEVKLLVDINEMMNHLKEYEKQNYLYEQNFSKFNYIKVSYEDFFENKDISEERIIQFLNAKKNNSVRDPDMKKINSKKISDRVINYEEVRNNLKNTSYSKFLD